MGTSTFANYTVLPEIAVAKIREDAPFGQGATSAAADTTGIGAVINTAKVRQGESHRIRSWRHRPERAAGPAAGGADMIIGVDINNDRRPGANASA
jgi:S-(hydroxymethyl)glutathione dehydrogenase/alcohol dehydrogenase